MSDISDNYTKYVVIKKEKKPKREPNKLVVINEEDLIRQVEIRPILYDKSLKGYRKSALRHQYWKEIAHAVGSSVSKCKHKWIGLRSSFSRHLRDERSKPRGWRGKMKKKWYMADAMSFLKDYVKQYPSVNSSLCSPDNEENADERSLPDSPASLNETQSTASTAKNSRVPCKTSKTLKSEMKASPMIEYLPSRSCYKPQDDASTLLFKSMLADYQKLSRKKQRVFRVQMINIMNKMQEEEEYEASNASNAVIALSPGAVLMNSNYDGQQQQFNL